MAPKHLLAIDDLGADGITDELRPGRPHGERRGFGRDRGSRLERGSRDRDDDDGATSHRNSQLPPRPP